MGKLNNTRYSTSCANIMATIVVVFDQWSARVSVIWYRRSVHPIRSGRYTCECAYHDQGVVLYKSAISFSARSRRARLCDRVVNRWR